MKENDSAFLKVLFQTWRDLFTVPACSLLSDFQVVQVWVTILNSYFFICISLSPFHHVLVINDGLCAHKVDGGNGLWLKSHREGMIPINK